MHGDSNPKKTILKNIRKTICLLINKILIHSKTRVEASKINIQANSLNWSPSFEPFD